MCNNNNFLFSLFIFSVPSFSGSSPDERSDLLSLRTARSGLLPSPSADAPQRELWLSASGPGWSSAAWQRHHSDRGSASCSALQLTSYPENTGTRPHRPVPGDGALHKIPVHRAAHEHPHLRTLALSDANANSFCFRGMLITLSGVSAFGEANISRRNFTPHADLTLRGRIVYFFFFLEDL